MNIIWFNSTQAQVKLKPAAQIRFFLWLKSEILVQMSTFERILLIRNLNTNPEILEKYKMRIRFHGVFRLIWKSELRIRYDPGIRKKNLQLRSELLFINPNALRSVNVLKFRKPNPFQPQNFQTSTDIHSDRNFWILK